jgi:hypothetical protein
MAIEQACGLANRLQREAQMLALLYVRFGPTRVAGELPDKPIVGLDGEKVVSFECYVIESDGLLRLLRPYVNFSISMTGLPRGAVLVSYAFRTTCHSRWKGRILVVLLHNCCMQSAHYCASTNFHVNEYIAVWFDANGFANDPIARVGQVGNLNELVAVDIEDLRSNNWRRPVVRMQVASADHPTWLDKFKLRDEELNAEQVAKVELVGGEGKHSLQAKRFLRYAAVVQLYTVSLRQNAAMGRMA